MNTRGKRFVLRFPSPLSQLTLGYTRMGASFCEFVTSDPQAPVMAVSGKPCIWRGMHSSTRRLDAAQSRI